MLLFCLSLLFFVQLHPVNNDKSEIDKQIDDIDKKIEMIDADILRAHIALQEVQDDVKIYKYKNVEMQIKKLFDTEKSVFIDDERVGKLIKQYIKYGGNVTDGLLSDLKFLMSTQDNKSSKKLVKLSFLMGNDYFIHNYLAVNFINAQQHILQMNNAEVLTFFQYPKVKANTLFFILCKFCQKEDIALYWITWFLTHNFCTANIRNDTQGNRTILMELINQALDDKNTDMNVELLGKKIEKIVINGNVEIKLKDKNKNNLKYYMDLVYKQSNEWKEKNISFMQHIQKICKLLKM